MTDTQGPSPAFASDDEISNKVPLDRENTLQMVRNDYDEPWKGVLREAIQNAVDAWGRNKSTGVLNEEDDLRVRFSVDTNSQILTYEDNAGGMTRETLIENLVGIDTPDEEKQKGESAGAYGRGFHVIACCGGGKTYVETKHGGEHWALTVNNSGHHSEPEDPDSENLTNSGTFIQVQNVFNHDIEDKLGDWAAVEDTLLGNFNFLLQRDDVDIIYTIDGANYRPDPVDLSKYRSDGELRHEESLPEFSASGEDYQVEELVVVEADTVDGDIPWEGIAMLKGNEYLEHPFMTVHTYQPYNIPSLRGSAEMFGWCDASDLCPDLEDNAHTSFQQNAPSKAGLKPILQEIHRENFKRGQTTEEREELRGDITNNINEILVEYDEFDEYQFPDEGVETDDDGESEGRGGDTEDSLITCHAGKRDYDLGDEIPLKIAIENPQDAKETSYEITNIEIYGSDIDYNHKYPSRDVDIGVNSSKEFNIDRFTPSNEGIYVFSAEAEGKDSDEYSDSSLVYIRVGDIDPEKTGDGTDDGENDQQVSIVESTKMSPDESEDWKAALEPGEQGGFDVILNTARPEWETAEEQDTEARQAMQKRLGIKWGVEQVVFNRNIEDVQEIVEEGSAEGADVAERIQNMMIERSNLFSKIEAQLVSEYGLQIN